MRAALALLLLCGCRQLLGFENPTVIGDASLDPDVIPDAGPCQAIAATCEAGVVLRECTTIGEQPIDTTCAWGCNDTGGAHCATLIPGGGSLTSADLTLATELAEVVVPAPSAILDTDNGTITNLRGGGQGVIDGIQFTQRNGVGVFRMKRLTVNGLLLIRGTRAVAIVATEGDIAINNVVDARGTCTDNDPGPGGQRGGTTGADAPGTGGGRRGLGNSTDAGGGGGGGHGVIGSRGGNGGAGAGGIPGLQQGAAQIAALVGGSGGGGGAKAGEGGVGGGGGGAIQLVSNTRIVIAVGNGINAGGCGGEHGAAISGGGGGGGSGGTILLEAPVVEIDGGLAVNGGGGGGAEDGTKGENAPLAVTRAQGGAATGAGDGGDGGGVGTQTGDQGADDNSSGGGGGGAVGRIRIHTFSGAAQLGATGFTSPSLLDPGTTATQGVAPTQ